MDMILFFFFCVEEYPLDSTRSYSTVTHCRCNSVVVESSRCSSKTFKKDHVHNIFMRLCTKLYSMLSALNWTELIIELN